jgi:hypothetical protein
MEEDLLFEGEVFITMSDNKKVVLTNRRLRLNNSTRFGRSHIISIMLEKISSIEIHYRSWPLFLLAGIGLVLIGLAAGTQNQGEAMMAAMLLGLVFIAVYLLTRKHIVTIASDGGAKIHFHTKGMKRASLMEFINKIENAKSKL